VGSVAMKMDDGDPWVMPAWPYAPGAEKVRDPSRSPVYRFAPMPLTPGHHTLTATPWSGRRADGAAGQPRTIALTAR